MAKFEKLGYELKAARERKGLSIDDLYSATKINRGSLISIENGEFDFIEELYITAFLKSIAGAVGLFPDDIIKKYKLLKEGKPIEDSRPIEIHRPVTLLDVKTVEKQEEPKAQEVKPEPEEPIKKNNEVKQEQKLSLDQEQKPEKEFVDATILQKDPEADSGSKIDGTFITGIVVVIAAIAAAVWYFMFYQPSQIISNSSGDEQEIVAQEGPRYEVPAITQDTNSVDSSGTLISDPMLGDSLALEFKTEDRVWIRLIDVKKRDTTDFYVAKDDPKRVVTIDSIKIVAGNSSALDVFLEGKPVDFIKKPGKRATFVITRGGVLNE